jgi:type IV secretory pathway VirB10-like protein
MLRSLLFRSHLRSGILFVGIAAVAMFSLACTRQEPAPTEEGSQISENQTEPEPVQPSEEAPTQAEQTPPADTAPRRFTPPAQAPAPRPAPRQPETVAVTVPESTSLKVKMEDPLNSGTTQAGDRFRATLVDAVVIGDRVALASGATIQGTVTDVVPAKKGIKESGGALTLTFDSISTSEGSVPMAASLSQVAKSTKKKAGTIGGAAAGGALLGKVLGGSTKDAAIGAVVGGAIGTGVAAGTKGTELKIEPGAELVITLQQPLTVHMRR